MQRPGSQLPPKITCASHTHIHMHTLPPLPHTHTAHKFICIYKHCVEHSEAKQLAADQNYVHLYSHTHTHTHPPPPTHTHTHTQHTQIIYRGQAASCRQKSYAYMYVFMHIVNESRTCIWMSHELTRISCIQAKQLADDQNHMHICLYPCTL